MGNLYKIKCYNRYNLFDVPAPYGFLIKKTEQMGWTSICYDEVNNINKRDFDPELEEYRFFEPDSIVFQLDKAINGKELERFRETVKGRHVSDGNYIPCLIDERLVLINSEFLKPL